MRLLLRLDDGAGTLHDRCLELAADATIGELTDHLAEMIGVAPGTSVIVDDEDRLVARSDPVATCGPRSGSTVRLRPIGSSTPSAVSTPSPVHLVSLRREDQPDTTQLTYGMHDLGGARLDISDRVELAATGAVVPTVNGARVHGSRRLRSGDLVGVGSTAALVRVDGPLRPPPRRGPQLDHPLTPAGATDVTPCEVDLPTPPGEVRLPGFPVLSATVPLLMGVALWVATRSPATAFFVLFSFAFVVASGLESRRESRAEQRFRVEQFHVELDDVVTRVEHQHRVEQAGHDLVTPHPQVVRRLADSHDPRLWERTTSGDGPPPMLVRLGSARQVPAMRLTVPTQGRRDLRVLAEQRADDLAEIDRACTIDLDEYHALALVGRGERCSGVARSVVAQLAALLAPDELHVEVLAGPDRRDVWRWVAWLPHAAATRRTPRSLLVVDAADEAEVAAALRRLDDDLGVRVLWLAAGRAGLPSGIDAVAELPEEGPAGVWLHGRRAEPMVDLAPEDLLEDEVEPFARALAPLVPRRSPVRLDGGHAAERDAPPDRVSLADVLPGNALFDDPDVVLERWAQARTTASLGAPVGLASNGVLHLDLRLDGPHTLIAGTTGSGKSELLRSLVTSLALHHPPDRLTFLLVDYKGGAAFGPISDLPHTVGLITDLSPQLAQRALISLRAEVRHRERQLSECGVSDLADASAQDATSMLPPALVVVVDEFATLSRELPAFVDGLVDVAQRGRSLGVHLVLATQRPAGVVTDAIRANTALRIALRVADEDDSRDVVDAPDAAHLSRSAPGRAVVRTGPGRVLTAQFAWSSGPVDVGARVRSWSLGTEAPDLGEPDVPASGSPPASQLNRALGTVCTAATRDARPGPRRPWLDPLPEHLDLDSLDGTDGGVAIGWVDRPDRQRQDPLTLDLTRTGGALVLGASGSGRSTTLMTIAAAVARHGTMPVRVHAIDADGGLDALRGTAGVGDVIAANDVERVLRVLRDVAAQLDRSPGGPRRLLLVDGVAALEEVHAGVNRGEAMDLLTRIARDGRAAGVHVVLAAQRRAEVPPVLAAALGWRLALRSPTTDEALLLGLDPDSASADTSPGRGHVHGEQVQIAWPMPLTPAERPSADTVGALPRSVTCAELSQVPADPEAAWGTFVCGIEADHLGPAVLDLRHHHALVAGPPRSGRTTTLATLAHLASRRGMAPRRIAAHSPSDGAALDVIALAESAALADEPTLLTVDDLPDLLAREPALEQALDSLHQLARTRPIRLVLSGECDALTRCYADVLTRVRSGRMGILLRPDPDVHAGLLHTRLPLRQELPEAPGRGWLLDPHGAVPIQVALPG